MKVLDYDSALQVLENGGYIKHDSTKSKFYILNNRFKAVGTVQWLTAFNKIIINPNAEFIAELKTKEYSIYGWRKEENNANS